RNGLERVGPLLALVPTGTYAAFWMSGVIKHRSDRGFDMAAHYAVTFVERLDPGYFIPRSIAVGPLTWALFGVMIAWVLSGLLRRGPARSWDQPLVWCAAFLALAYLALPSKYLNTIE